MKEIDNSNGNEETAAALVRAFMPYIRKRASRVHLVGLAYDDVVQEGLIGLFSAVDGYDSAFGTAFETYAITCIDNHIRSALRREMRKKNIPLNDYYSFSDSGGEQWLAGAEPAISLEDFVIVREEVRDTVKRIHLNLSSFEKDVLALYLEGYSYLAISELLSSTPKSVDNALQRARRKLKKQED